MDVDEDTPAKGKAPAATEDSADAMATDGAAEGSGSRAGAKVNLTAMAWVVGQL